MKVGLWLTIGALAMAAATTGFAQDGVLGKGGGKPKQGGGSGGSGSGSGTKPKSEPPPKSGGGGGGGTTRDRGQSGDGALGNGGGTVRTGSGSSRDRDRGEVRQSADDGLLGKRSGGSSRSGQVQYGTNSNVRVEAPPRFGDIPRVSSDRQIVLEGYRENRVRVGSGQYDDRYRNGYWHYDQRWRDDYFWYPHYSFNYDPYRCAPSPFYWYGHLPPYVDLFRVSIGSFTWTACTTQYNWQRSGWGDSGWNNNDRGWGYDRSRELDYAIDDLVSAFERRSARSIGGLVPPEARVLVELSDGSRYRTNGDDFYDMFRDLIEGTRTADYRVMGVWRDRDQATVTADHTFYDGWGRMVVVRHTYGLEEGRRGYEICYFRADRRGW
jgi:hypothetical protein